MRPVEGQQGSFTNVRDVSEVYGDELNTEFWEDMGRISIHDGGRTVFFTSDRHYRRDPDGTREDTSGPFIDFTNRGILENVNSEYDECSSTISANGLTLALRSTRSNQGTRVDIWAATRPSTDVPFGEPFMPLGLNSEHSDKAPFFSVYYGGVFAAGEEPDDDRSFEALRAQFSLEPPPPPSSRFIRGDCNDDGAVDISDASCALDWLFAGRVVSGCLSALNANGDAKVDIADPVYLLNFMFAGGPRLSAPYPDCGPGPAAEKLGCANPPNCQ